MATADHPHQRPNRYGSIGTCTGVTRSSRAPGAAPVFQHLALLCCALLGPGASAIDFHTGEWEGLLDFTVSYGAIWRFEETDDRLIALASDGSRRDSNIDDGDLNFDRGFVSSMFRGDVQLTLIRGDLGVFVRGGVYYDPLIKDRQTERTAISSAGEDDLGYDARIKEALVSYSFTPGGLPVFLRVGRQIINWGETSFLRDGVDVVNPIDLIAVFQPATQAQDTLEPAGMLWGAVNPSETLSVEAFYQYEWVAARLPPVGAAYSSNDLLGSDGVGTFTGGGGLISDLGTDLDTLLRLPPGTLGFDDDFQQIPGAYEEKPRDGGQWGISLQQLLPGRNVSTVGLHHMRYHSRLPLITAITGSSEAVLATSQQAVDGRAAALTPAYLAQGLPADAAAVAAATAAESLTLSAYGNEAGVVVLYPEDIDMFGATFSTATLATGTLIAAEISHHRKVPVQIGLGTVFRAVYSPVLFDPEIGTTALGDYGPDEIVQGYLRLDRTQASLGLTQLFTRRLGASQVLVAVDAGWVHIHDLPDSPMLQPPGISSPDSWGYRLYASADYPGVFGGMTLSPRLAFSHDVSGITPSPYATFLEGRKSLSAGIKASIINRVIVELDYTSFFDGGDGNLLRDRDFARFRVVYAF